MVLKIFYFSNTVFSFIVVSFHLWKVLQSYNKSLILSLNSTA